MEGRGEMRGVAESSATDASQLGKAASRRNVGCASAAPLAGRYDSDHN